MLLRSGFRCPRQLWALGAFTLLATVVGCPPAARDLAVQDSVQQRWDQSEKELREYAARLPKLAAPAAGKAFDVEALGRFAPSERHGAAETMLLPWRDSRTHRIISAGPLATITAVMGVEYKSDDEFLSPQPVAIIDVVGGPYPTLFLQPGRNYWLIQHVGADWVAWIQSVPSTGVAPAAVFFPMSVPAMRDPIAPVQVARFAVTADSVGFWNYSCSRHCCPGSPLGPIPVAVLSLPPSPSSVLPPH